MKINKTNFCDNNKNSSKKLIALKDCCLNFLLKNYAEKNTLKANIFGIVIN